MSDEEGEAMARKQLRSDGPAEDDHAAAAAYIFSVKVSSYHDERRPMLKVVEGKVMTADGVEVGSLEAVLVDRTDCDDWFLDVCDEISRDMQLVSQSFCNSDGEVVDPKVAEKVSEEASQGGFLYIDDMKIDEAHRGNDLGIRFLDAVLRDNEMKNMWTLCILQPFVHLDDPDYQAKMEDHSYLERITRHFMRMGFQQGPLLPTCIKRFYWYYFLEQSAMFEPGVLLTRAEANAIELAPGPRLEFVQNPYDKQLDELAEKSIREEMDLAELTNRINALVEQGGSLSRSLAPIHFAANKKLLEVMLVSKMGANMNIKDLFGITPLHAAGVVASPITVSLLLSLGADKTIRNSKGETPSEHFNAQIQHMARFKMQFGVVDPGMTDEERIVQALLA